MWKQTIDRSDDDDDDGQYQLTISISILAKLSHEAQAAEHHFVNYLVVLQNFVIYARTYVRPPLQVSGCEMSYCMS